jgi:hydrogenase maturation protease
MTNFEKDILILGLGNEVLMDDRIGPKLVDDLKESIVNPNVIFETAAVGGLELIEMIRDYKKVIIIDAIKTSDGIPGSVYYLTPADFKETLHLSNRHDISFLTALHLAKKLNIEITDDIRIIAVEIIEDMVFSEIFSPPVQEKYPEIYNTIKNYVISLTG